jgi:hypothetical protein
MDIDAIIAEATIEVAPEQSAPEQAADDNNEVVTEEAPAVESKQEEKPEPDLRNMPDSELTPEQLAKRELNRKSHTNSKLARLARENRELKARLEAPKQSQEPQAPNMDNFDTLEEFMDARDAYRETKLSAQNKPEPQITPVQAQEFVRAAESEAAFEKAVPEYTKLVAENTEFFKEYLADPKLQTAIFEADNAPLALYALMKEGLIGELYDLTPTKLAAELAKAEIRGQSYLVPKKTVTNAPAPIESVKGTGSGSKSIERMTPTELKEWLAS